MPAGLQVWSADGKLRLEVIDRLSRFYATYSLTPWQDDTTRFIAVDGMTDDGYWVVTLPCPDYSATIGNGGLTIRSNKINFTGFTSVPVTLYRI
jgi:hypothetical protein